MTTTIQRFASTHTHSWALRLGMRIHKVIPQFVHLNLQKVLQNQWTKRQILQVSRRGKSPNDRRYLYFSHCLTLKANEKFPAIPYHLA